WQEGIATVTKGLRSGYLSQGLRTPQQIVNKYAPASDGNDTGVWSGNVSSFMHEMGANPLTAGPKTAFSSTPISLDSPPQIQPAAFSKLIALDVGKSPELQVRNLVDAMIAQQHRPAPATPRSGGGVSSIPLPPSGGGGLKLGRALLSAGADRAGVPTQ